MIANVFKMGYNIDIGNCETNLKLECDEEKTNSSGFFGTCRKKTKIMAQQ